MTVLFSIKDEVIDTLLILVDAPFVSLCLCLRVRKKGAVCVCFPADALIVLGPAKTQVTVNYVW